MRTRSEEKVKTIMVSKRVWRETQKKCSEKGLQTFCPNSLLRHIDALTSKDSAVSLISSMRILGLLDKNAELTDLGKLWAQEDTYIEACQKIITSCFPAEIYNSLINGTDSKRNVIERYAMLTDMNLAGAEKNIRFLNMLINDTEGAVRHTKLDKHTQSSVYTKGPGTFTQTERTHTFSPDTPATTSPSNSNTQHLSEAAAEITITAPKHMIADVFCKVIAAVDMPEVSINARVG